MYLIFNIKILTGIFKKKIQVFQLCNISILYIKEFSALQPLDQVSHCYTFRYESRLSKRFLLLRDVLFPHNNRARHSSIITVGRAFPSSLAGWASERLQRNRNGFVSPFVLPSPLASIRAPLTTKRSHACRGIATPRNPSRIYIDDDRACNRVDAKARHAVWSRLCSSRGGEGGASNHVNLTLHALSAREHITPRSLI